MHSKMFLFVIQDFLLMTTAARVFHVSAVVDHLCRFLILFLNVSALPFFEHVCVSLISKKLSKKDATQDDQNLTTFPFGASGS